MLKLWNRLIKMNNNQHTFDNKKREYIRSWVCANIPLMISEWLNEVHTKPKLRTYNYIKTEFIVEP